MKRTLLASVFLTVLCLFSACGASSQTGSPPAGLRFDGEYLFSAGETEYRLTLTAENGSVNARLLSPEALSGFVLRYDGEAVTVSLNGVTGEEPAKEFFDGTLFGAMLKQAFDCIHADVPAENAAADETGLVLSLESPVGGWRLEKTAEAASQTEGD